MIVKFKKSRGAKLELGGAKDPFAPPIVAPIEFGHSIPEEYNLEISSKS